MARHRPAWPCPWRWSLVHGGEDQSKREGTEGHSNQACAMPVGVGVGFGGRVFIDLRVSIHLLLIVRPQSLAGNAALFLVARRCYNPQESALWKLRGG